MEKTMKTEEAMIEPIEEVIGSVAYLEKKPEKLEIIEVKPAKEEKPVVAVVSTINESPDFKSIVKTPLETKKPTKKTHDRRPTLPATSSPRPLRATGRPSWSSATD